MNYNYNGKNNICRGCGKCCDIISMSLSWNDILEMSDENNLRKAEYQYDIDFIRKYWIPINNPVDIWRLNPNRRIDFDHNYYYNCTKFNRITRKCDAYKYRPPVCFNYPYYGKNEHVSLLSDNCVFNKI